MTRKATALMAAIVALTWTGAATAQSDNAKAQDSSTTKVAPADSSAQPAPPTQPPISIQHINPIDKRGLNTFEAPKRDDTPFSGFRLDFGAAFTQEFQGLHHSNSAAPNMKTDASGNEFDANQLMDIGNGFNTATANLYLNAQLAKGVRVAMTTYLSSRHHTDTWVKDGYLQIDASPIDNDFLNTLMEFLTIKAGHFEINYGDAHFRRSDNGNSLQNPFVGNLILDAFTTEIGGEVYARLGGLMAMGGITGGQINGDVTNPDGRSPALLAKLGYDSQITPDLRVRLTGSRYSISKSPSNTLYWGNRAGEPYFLVMENTQASTSSQAWSGTINPGLSNKVTAYQINPFVKYQHLELFGVIERAEGRSSSETSNRTLHQYAADAVYRFLPGEPLFVGARYNTMNGELQGITNDVNVHRVQLSGGWFITPSVLMKLEYVKQTYNDFPATDIRNGGKFDGFMMTGVVAF